MRKRGPSFLLVDGYNIIHSWGELKELAEESLESARDKLIEILSDYRGATSSEIIVVFDAHKVKGSIGSNLQCGNIFVVYTKEAETADRFIEKTVKSISRDYNVTVATSDNLEQMIIYAEGAARISARELYGQVTAVRDRVRKEFTARRGIKENTLFSRLSPETSEYLESIRLK